MIVVIIEEYVIVVEIKADGDTSDENLAKYKYAKQHFEDLNKDLEAKNIAFQYLFHFLSPNNYIVFFEHLRNSKLLKNQFTSGLDSLLGGEGNG